MVQLSIQDMTQESKVRTRTALWGGGCECECDWEDCSWDEVSPLGCL